MKTLLNLTTLSIITLIAVYPCFSQDQPEKLLANNLATINNESQYASENDNKVKSEPRKDDVVINMAMIESFRRCYNKIQPFSFADYFRGDASDISLKYTAYMRLRYKNVKDSLNAALTSEMESLKTEMANNTKLTTTIAFAEEKVKDQPNSLASSDQTFVSNDKASKTGNDKSKNLKWTKVKK